MKFVAVGDQLGAACCPNFARSKTFLLVDTESMESETVANPAVDTPRGAGVEAAQWIVDREADGVIAQRIGPKAWEVLEAAEIPVYLAGDQTVAQALEAVQAGTLERADGPRQ